MEPAWPEETRLAASDLAYRRGDRVLFRSLSLTLDSGQAVQLTGANGTGKSSLIRILAGLLRPLAGTVERAGRVALLDDRPALDGDLPLARALEFWTRLDAPSQGRHPPVGYLGLDGLLDVPVRYLSTGQRKRAALARVAAQGAPLWMLDEPLNGLDRDAVALCEALVAEHCAAGGIAVIASHQPFALPGLAMLAVPDFAP
ncbi:MAG: heme ABC exporter ATP-binding protein CcmA [Croceibacterium sp.]